MTRCRAKDNLPNSLLEEYYARRSSAGLIITEGTAPSASGLGYARMPGLFNESQEQAWKKVVDRVHEKGGKIFLQLMHTGRIASRHNLPPHAKIWAPSSITAPGNIYTDGFGLVPHDEPSELSKKDIQGIISEYAASAEAAIRAGFDGVEIHAASGYLPNQFLSDNVNQRSDEYGGTIQNKIRFILELVEAVSEAAGKFRTGIKLSPGMVYNDIIIDDNISIYKKLIQELNAFPLAYLHLMRVKGTEGEVIIADAKNLFHGNLMVGGGFDLNEAQDFLKQGLADLIAVGTPFIANPDLLFRWKNHYPLNHADRSKFYSEGPEGYIDYPNVNHT
jgi:N-ethylmaleimide reductase